MQSKRWLMMISMAVLSVCALRGANAWWGGQQSQIPADIQSTLNDIDDIDKLRVLNPLRLSAEQLDKVIKIVKDTQLEYTKTIADTAVPMFRQTSSEVKSTKRQLLGGGAIPSSFDSKVRKLQSDYMAKRASLDEKTVRSLAAQFRQVLTEDQFKAAVETTRGLTMNRDGKKATGSDEQFFNFYVTGTFIAYGRIVPLLEEMKASRSGAQN